MRALIAFFATSCAMWLPTAGAGDIPFTGRFAGTVVNHFQLDESGNPASFIISEAEMKGSQGASRVSVLSQFVPDFSLTVCQPGEIPLSLVYARSVTTFQDLSVQYATSDSGWMCGKAGPLGMAGFYGEVSAQIIGGTGRFAGATGYYEGEFHGNDLAGSFVVECPTCAPEIPFPGYGSFLGTIRGELHLPN